jgi:ABC-type transport system substrate-binding protein
MKQRKRIFYRLQDLAADTLPVIPLVHEQTIVVHARDLKGYTAKVYGTTLATTQKD